MAQTHEAVQAAPLRKTPLHALHLELGAKMVPFAGYDMPVQYGLGVLGEHLHTRDAAGLFDVSHMGQAFLTGPDHETTARALEALVPGDLIELAPGQMRYSLLLNDKGGILDDLMITRSLTRPGALYLVVNAACKEADFAHIGANLPPGLRLERLEDRGLIALQGPRAAEVLGRFAPEAAVMAFMTGCDMDVAGIACIVSRSGYTGEDGFEISVPAARADELARLLLDQPEVEAIGLGARDSLRLEAGLCLYGHDIDETTTPVEAALTWAIGKRRRAEANFPGAAIILDQIANGAPRKRVGILPEGKAPAREGTQIVDRTGAEIGVITSGGFGPTVNGPIAMGYVAARHAGIGSAITLMVRARARPATVVPLPFVPKRFYRAA